MRDQSNQSKRLHRLQPSELYRYFLETANEEEASICRRRLLELALEVVSKVACKIMRAHVTDMSGYQRQEEGADEISVETCWQLGRQMDLWRAAQQITKEAQNRVTPSEVHKRPESDTETKVPVDYAHFCSYATHITYTARKQWLRKTFRKYVGSSLEVRYLLARFETLAIWTDGQGNEFAGYRVWQTNRILPANEKRIDSILTDPIAAAKNGLTRRGKNRASHRPIPSRYFKPCSTWPEGP